MQQICAQPRGLGDDTVRMWCQEPDLQYILNLQETDFETWDDLLELSGVVTNEKKIIMRATDEKQS
jgi:hypothetical protein